MGNWCCSFDYEKELLALRHEFSVHRSQQHENLVELERHISIIENSLHIVIKKTEKIDQQVAEQIMNHKISASKIQSNYSFINNKSCELDGQLDKIRKDSYLGPRVVSGANTK